MQFRTLKQLFTEDRAVSPVISVVLMVAITVILAAVIGTFVLGLGDDLQNTQPIASFDFDYDANSNATVTITHQGGDTLPDGDTVTVTVTGTASFDENSWDGAISAGNSKEFVLDEPDWSGQTVSVNWESADGSTSMTLATSTAPSS